MRPVADFEAGPVGFSNGGGEEHGKLVRSIDEKFINREAVGAVLVAGGSDLMTVEGYRGDSVQSLEDQLVAVVPVGSPLECCGVFPVAFADPGHLLLVLIEVGVGDQVRGKQIGMYQSWDSCGE